MRTVDYNGYALIIRDGEYEIVEGVGTIYTTDDQGIEVKTFATEESMQSYIEENNLLPKELPFTNEG